MTLTHPHPQPSPTLTHLLRRTDELIISAPERSSKRYTERTQPTLKLDIPRRCRPRRRLADQPRSRPEIDMREDAPELRTDLGNQIAVLEEHVL